MVLDILICTFNDGIKRIPEILLESNESVHYTISHQYTDESYLRLPENLIERKEVLISQIPGKGLSKNRNNALLHAIGDIVLIADDDVFYKMDYLESIIEKFENDPSIDVACFKINTGNGNPEYKNYPKVKTTIKKISQHTPSSIEIAFKRESIIRNNILFDERFGLGTSIKGGEEGIFIHDCILKKLKVVFFPQYIVEHPYESTTKSLSKYHKVRVSVTGATDARLNGFISIPKSIFGTIKVLPDLIRSKKNPIIYFIQRFTSSIYILFTKPHK